MPVDWTRYPSNWPLFRIEIRDQRAQGRCECTGECGIHRPNPTPRRCVELHHKPARWFHGTVRLTLAHLCQCDPPCTNPEHVKAMCQRCHLRVDRFRHARARLTTIRDPARKTRLATRPRGEPPWPGARNARDTPPQRASRHAEGPHPAPPHPPRPQNPPNGGEVPRRGGEGAPPTTTSCHTK